MTCYCLLLPKAPNNTKCVLFDSKEWKCCGLKSYKDLLPTNINKTFAIGKNAAKAQKIINDKQLTYKNYKYCFKTTYWTYCEDKNNNCTVFGPSANLSLVYEKKVKKNTFRRIDYLITSIK